MQENERYRGLIETLLRHPAFTPFINDISNDPSVLTGLQQQRQPAPQQQQPSSTPQPQQQVPSQHQQQQPQQDAKPDYMNFDASQLQVPSQQATQQQQQQTERVGLAMIPENDFSKLNINGFQGFNNYHQVNAFAVTEVPKGPDLEDLIPLAPAQLSAACSASSDSASMDLLLAKLGKAARSLEGVHV